MSAITNPLCKPLVDLQAIASEIEVAMFMAMNKSGEVGVQVSDGGASIEIVRIMVGQERAGLGTKALHAACEIAGSHGVSLELMPDGSYYENAVEAKARLVVFYSRFGFTDSGHGTMVRTADASKHAVSLPTGTRRPRGPSP